MNSLNSSSGIFANKNLSILFSSHTNIINLKKTLDPNRYKLLIPNNTNIEHKNNEYMTIDTNKIPCNDSELIDENLEEICYARSEIKRNKDYGLRNRRRKDELGIYNLNDFGDFPETLNLLQNCQNDKNDMCLNMLNKNVPGMDIHKNQFNKNQIKVKNNFLFFTLRNSFSIFCIHFPPPNYKI